MNTRALSQLSLFFGLLISGCVTNPPLPSSSFDEWFLGQRAYIQKECSFLSTRLELVKALPGTYCLLRGRNIVIGHQDRLYEINEKLQILWEIKPIYVHHQLNSSQVDNSLLTIESEYSHRSAPSPSLVRYDKLIVLSNKGKIIKSFSLMKYMKKNKMDSGDWNNNWTVDGKQKKSIEKTHVNAFRELYTTVNDQKVLSGYIAYCNQQRLAFIFDTKLKKIVRTLNFKNRSIHDIRQYNENELIFFLNENPDEPEPRKTRIETYNLVTNEINVLYQNNLIKAVYPYCGSVQPLPRDRLFIRYSTCNAKFDDPNVTSYFEMVDLKTMKSTLLPAAQWQLGNSSSIIDHLPLTY